MMLLGQRIVSFEEPYTLIAYVRLCGGGEGSNPPTYPTTDHARAPQFGIIARHKGLGGGVGVVLPLRALAWPHKRGVSNLPCREIFCCCYSLDIVVGYRTIEA